jgi:NAD+ synthase (glutamine-hydrolysing)
MEAYGFIRVAAAVPRVRVGDCAHNARQTAALLESAAAAGAQVVVFPECGLTGYTCADLFQQDSLLQAALDALNAVAAATQDVHAIAVVGLPFAIGGQIFNCAAVVSHGSVHGIVPKTLIPNYKEYYEQRWFTSARALAQREVKLGERDIPCGTDMLFYADQVANCVLAVELCEDLWVPTPPSAMHAMAGATVICNPSASNELVAKSEYRRALVVQQSGRCVAGYVMAAAGVGESTTDLVFGGHTLVAENAVMLAEGERFRRDESFVTADIDVQRLTHDRRFMTTFHDGADTTVPQYRRVHIDGPLVGWEPPLQRPLSAHPFVPANPGERDLRCREIFAIQTAGLAKRLEHCRAGKAVIGVSGGLDSTLALLVCVHTFDLLGTSHEGIHAVTMPGYGTSEQTYSNVTRLCRALGLRLDEIDITPACDQHLQDIGHDPGDHSVVFENAQARERTQILFDLANKLGGILVGTGDLSELALGWCTYGGDQISMYNVNCGVPKTLVRYLIQWVADTQEAEDAREVLHAILDTPISPELLPTDAAGAIAQKTEDTIGPYELHDFFLYHLVRCGMTPAKILFLAGQAFEEDYTDAELRHWLRVFLERFFAQQFKRSCMPDGPKVGTVSLSPRGDWRMPSDAEVRVWLDDVQRET